MCQVKFKKLGVTVSFLNGRETDNQRIIIIEFVLPVRITQHKDISEIEKFTPKHSRVVYRILDSVQN